MRPTHLKLETFEEMRGPCVASSSTDTFEPFFSTQVQIKAFFIIFQCFMVALPPLCSPLQPQRRLRSLVEHRFRTCNCNAAACRHLQRLAPNPASPPHPQPKELQKF